MTNVKRNLLLRPVGREVPGCETGIELSWLVELTVPVAEEIARTDPVIRLLRAELETPISIDTRKAHVARAALHAGANIINDVSGFTYDPDLTGEAATHKVPVCVMHALGDPATMQNDPHYDNVVLDVWAFLEARVAALELAGVPRTRILVDPGIGFGKALEHNLAFLATVGSTSALHRRETRRGGGSGLPSGPMVKSS